MAGRIQNATPRSMRDLELSHQEAGKSRKKKGAAPVLAAEETEAELESTKPLPPVNIRYLGRNIDLIV